MCAMTSEDRLIFNEIKSGRHTAYGVLTDDAGNTFSIEVKGTNKADVERFINYELGQTMNGAGITTDIKPISRKQMKSKKSKHMASKKTDSYTQTQTAWRGISIKFKPLEIKHSLDKPHKVRLIIDPPIDTGKSMDFPIDQQKEANVKCAVSTGKVTIELFEFVDKTKNTTTSHASDTVTPGKPAEFDIPQSKTDGTADWNFRVTGETKSTFTLTLDLNVK